MLGISRIIRQIPAADNFVFTAARSYIDTRQGFNSNLNQNGEAKLLQAAARLFQGRKVVFCDGGANMGSWTEEALKYFPESEGHLFEMMPSTFSELEVKFANNSNLKVNSIGLGDQETEAEAVNYGDGNSCNTLVVSHKSSRRKAVGTIKVKTTTLDQYCRNNEVDRIDLWKLDVEGYELLALLGAKKLLEQNRIGIIQYEYSTNNLERKEIARDFYEFLTPFGYKIGQLRPWGVVFSDYHTSLNCVRSGPNFVACLPEYQHSLEKFS